MSAVWGTPLRRATCSAASANSSPWISTTGPESLQMNSQLGHRQSPVERQEDGAQPPAGELQLEDVGVVHAEHRHPVAACDPEGAGEPQGGARDALVERGIGEASAGSQIVRRFGARREARVMGDPVFRGDFPKSCVSFPVCPQVGLQMIGGGKGGPRMFRQRGSRVSAQYGAQKLGVVFPMKDLTFTKVSAYVCRSYEESRHARIHAVRLSGPSDAGTYPRIPEFRE